MNQWEPGVFDDRLLCEVNSIHYDFRRKIGGLELPDGHACDMRGCISMFEAIDRQVIAIVTFSGDERDTVYLRRDGEWKAFPPESAARGIMAKGEST